MEGKLSCQCLPYTRDPDSKHHRRKKGKLVEGREERGGRAAGLEAGGCLGELVKLLGSWRITQASCTCPRALWIPNELIGLTASKILM